jgi:hypothetical protein|nr:hypothetical protein [uncultured Albidiferax sp.]
MKVCPLCSGQGVVAIPCACGVMPVDHAPLQACATCHRYRWTGCYTCDQSGELTPMQFSRLAMGLADGAVYGQPKEPQTVPGVPGD